MKTLEEEMQFQKGKLQTLSIYTEDGPVKEIVKELQDQNQMILDWIENERQEAIKFNKEHGIDTKHLERD